MSPTTTILQKKKKQALTRFYIRNPQKKTFSTNNIAIRFRPVWEHNQYIQLCNFCEIRGPFKNAEEVIPIEQYLLSSFLSREQRPRFRFRPLAIENILVMEFQNGGEEREPAFLHEI